MTAEYTDVFDEMVDPGLIHVVRVFEGDHLPRFGLRGVLLNGMSCSNRGLETLIHSTDGEELKVLWIEAPEDERELTACNQHIWQLFTFVIQARRHVSTQYSALRGRIALIQEDPVCLLAGESLVHWGVGDAASDEDRLRHVRSLDGALSNCEVRQVDWEFPICLEERFHVVHRVLVHLVK